MSLNELAQEIHLTAKKHGWWQKEVIPTPNGDISIEPNIPEKLALIHSEVSEALEESRIGTPLTSTFLGTDDKPIGFSSELADIIIRVLDLAAYLSIDIDKAVAAKVAYNKYRPYRHGNKLE